MRLLPPGLSGEREGTPTPLATTAQVGRGCRGAILPLAEKLLFILYYGRHYLVQGVQVGGTPETTPPTWWITGGWPVRGELREVSTVRRLRVYPIIGKQYLGITDAELRFTQAQPNVMNSQYACVFIMAALDQAVDSTTHKKGYIMLSIIIPTFNESFYLPRLLASLAAQTFTDFEVIVADNHSTDGTGVIALQFGARVVTGGSPAQGRNCGAETARGETLLFLDADVILPSDFLARALDEYMNAGCVVASCCVQPISEERIDLILHQVVNQYLKLTERVYPHAPGCCIFSNSETHRRINGFDETITLAEDHDYVLRASKTGTFRLLRNIRVPISVRRLELDGRLSTSLKYIAIEAHLIFVGNIHTNIFNYRFGHYKPWTGPETHNLTLRNGRSNRHTLNQKK